MINFINTRPQDRAQSLTLALQQAGCQVIEFALLTLVPIALTDDLHTQYQQFIYADCVVVVSVTAAELGLKYYFELGYSLHDLNQKQWIAVGKATQKYLEKFNIHSHVPEIETSEGMLDLPLLKQNTPTSIAFWRGIGGRTFMMEQLKSQGCSIINMLLYKRDMPQHTPSLAGTVPTHAIVLISSEESWNNWCKLGKLYQWDLENYDYIVLGQRVTQVLQHYFLMKEQTVKMQTIDRLNDIDSIVQYVQSYTP